MLNTEGRDDGSTPLSRLVYNLKTAALKIKFTSTTGQRQHHKQKVQILNPFFNVAQKRHCREIKCLLFSFPFLCGCVRLFAIIIILRPLCLRRVFLPRGLFSFCTSLFCHGAAFTIMRE
jgi:hypothetical protein